MKGHVGEPSGRAECGEYADLESAPNVESTEHRSGFTARRAFTMPTLPGYGAQSPVTREAFAYDFFPRPGISLPRAAAGVGSRWRLALRHQPGPT